MELSWRLYLSLVVSTFSSVLFGQNVVEKKEYFIKKALILIRKSLKNLEIVLILHLFFYQMMHNYGEKKQPFILKQGNMNLH